MTRFTLFAVVTVATLGSMHRSAEAAIVTVNFAGSVTSFTGPGTLLPDIFDVGDAVSGSFSFDTSVVGSFTTTSGFFIQPLVTSFDANIDGDSFQRGSFYRTQTTKVPGFDRLEVLTFDPMNSLALPPGFSVLAMTLDLQDLTGTAISSLSMPASIDFADWTSITLKIDVGNSVSHISDSELRATVTLVNVVPEPGSMTLIGLGAVGLIGTARRRRVTA